MTALYCQETTKVRSFSAAAIASWRLCPLHTTAVNIITPTPYCDDRLCVSVSVCVCPRAYLWKYTSDLYQILYASCLWPWLGPLLAGLRNVLCFRLTDDVTLAHKPIKTAQRGHPHAALDLAINGA